VRQRVSNPKTLRKLSRLAGFEVVDALVRGNTGHRADVVEADGTCWSVWPDGEVQSTSKIDSRFVPGHRSHFDLTLAVIMRARKRARVHREQQNQPCQ
jgi:hypothetical protein